ncbi:His-Xaa-Ser system radical SAM maturase HxsC [Bradyrhizobium elkanii]|nr:His-Xaa-Ser system radical SAM maturase HxsC [Bradyrhizobium elkanii]MCS3519289.1 His-Xaa-Ser system radical SAM maturase HxsC [Bradyrhizobium elkanii]MCS4066946.1 His-Xaa-Ser system radical SAM maturase HxsC [Bradyrhizobium elkanii]MCS4082481.1 His-Xaa-Ser system radical SAM maturase HxsC [Bradyrhizobium elkanii]MCW2127900.1 His-Xaa-Ser system radical SAM maturase HxsC [Bradyrhizobium elkanii]MCW2174643.1 His-Xaa-Ser system radical SAM maturase HxsC [Bradyrhizobium elkanii]
MADFALARTPAEVRRAVEVDWQSMFIVSDGSIDLPATFKGRLVTVPPKYDYLADGDVVGFDHASRKFRTLYRRKSAHNSFLVTERCNNYCLMCSQPPKDVDDRWILSEIKESLCLIDPATRALTFTGGETLSDWEDFIAVLKECRDRLPATAIQVLTNGRAFADSRIVDAWKEIGHPNLMTAIPVYASVDHIHDHVVQAKDAFDETILGILKLKDRGQPVEIRVVLHALTAPIIEDTGRWLARNLPFVDHVALMGLENTGFAIANDAVLWMDPVDYGEGLARAVEHLSAAGVNVSIYNLPKCVLPKSVWPHAVQSISDWKNGFVEECDRCDAKNTCSGFFTTGRPRFSRGVRAITSEREESNWLAS